MRQKLRFLDECPRAQSASASNARSSAAVGVPPGVFPIAGCCEHGLDDFVEPVLRDAQLGQPRYPRAGCEPRE